jgi:hypothetical protein
MKSIVLDMMKYKVIGFLCVLAFAKAELSHAQSQEKIEREEKITVEDFPNKALEMVNELGFVNQNIQYFKETDGNRTSYEAKLKKKGSKYSVEFDASGTLEDVEIEISRRRINKSARAKINKRLDTMARKYRIEKVQEQYLFKNQTAAQLLTKMKQKTLDHYEVIVAFKEKRKIYRKEMLFNREGTLVKQRTIKRLQYDFLLF